MTVKEVLHQIGRVPVYFHSHGGNHGDTLIRVATDLVLQDAGTFLVDSPNQADVILLRGGGFWGVNLWQKHFEVLREYTLGYPDKRIIILPGSFLFDGPDFARLFDGRTAPAILFARERYSHKLIQSQMYSSDVTCLLDHDMAFALEDTEFLKNLKVKSSEENLLLVERFDPEGDLPIQDPAVINYILGKLPYHLRYGIARRMHSRKVRGSSFSSEALWAVHKSYPHLRNLPVLAQDIQSKLSFNFKAYLDAISRAAVVVSTRLHVSILAVLLGKKTFIKFGPANYGKIKGVYEYSMTKFEHLHVLELRGKSSDLYLPQK